MNPSAIRVFPLSKITESKDFKTLDKVHDFFQRLKSEARPKFQLRSKRAIFIKGSLILFQYILKGEGAIIVAHAVLCSDGYIPDTTDPKYIGYYLLDPKTILVYETPITKQEIFDIWGMKLSRARLNLDLSEYDEYIRLLERKGDLP